ncbi:uncharacterized protein LOC125037871 [Penaeus chinensis]|uniref:uncharacterized protein LOC125037871 n=1 Tax=Penaeus chinensis TaxID=139456 RepID=UPI001FB6D40F|nr:uncharacterized protein LOC125037871 [Penaeus chinensis]
MSSPVPSRLFRLLTSRGRPSRRGVAPRLDASQQPLQSRATLATAARLRLRRSFLHRPFPPSLAQIQRAATRRFLAVTTQRGLSLFPLRAHSSRSCVRRLANTLFSSRLSSVALTDSPRARSSSSALPHRRCTAARPPLGASRAAPPRGRSRAARVRAKLAPPAKRRDSCARRPSFSSRVAARLRAPRLALTAASPLYSSISCRAVSRAAPRLRSPSVSRSPWPPLARSKRAHRASSPSCPTYVRTFTPASFLLRAPRSVRTRPRPNL